MTDKRIIFSKRHAVFLCKCRKLVKTTFPVAGKVGLTATTAAVCQSFSGPSGRAQGSLWPGVEEGGHHETRQCVHLSEWLLRIQGKVRRTQSPPRFPDLTFVLLGPILSQEMAGVGAAPSLWGVGACPELTPNLSQTSEALTWNMRHLPNCINSSPQPQLWRSEWPGSGQCW